MRQLSFTSLWWQLSLSFLGVVFLAVVALSVAVSAINDARRSFETSTDVDLPRLNFAADMTDTAMRLVTLRNHIGDHSDLTDENLEPFRKQFQALQNAPEFAERANALDRELSQLWQMAAERQSAQSAQSEALTELRWLNIDLEGELAPLRDDLRFDIEIRATRGALADVGAKLRTYDMLQDLDTVAGAVVTLMFQAATTHDRLTFEILSTLVADALDDLRLHAAKLPDRSDFLTLRQTMSYLAEQVEGGQGLMVRHLTLLEQQKKMQRQLAQVQQLTEALHQDLLARAQAERSEVLTAAEERAVSANRQLQLVAGIGSVLLVISLLVILGHYRRGVVRPLVQLSSALQRISAGQTDVAIPATRPNELGEMAEAVRGFRQSVQERERINRLLQEEVEGHKSTLQQLKDAQADLVQAAKLATLGELSAGLNHELNQPLMSLQHRLHSLESILADDAFPDRAEISERVGRLSDLTRRMIGTVQHLKRFSRKGDLKTRRPVELYSTIEGAESLIRYRLRNADVELQVDPDVRQFSVLGDAGLLEQIFLNLFANALEAIEDRFSDTGNGVIAISAERIGARVVIRVRDNGIGLVDLSPEDAMAPFVTGKAPGRGLGLGLSMSRKIAEDLGGTLMIEPGSPAGVVVMLTLPGVPYAEH